MSSLARWSIRLKRDNWNTTIFTQNSRNTRHQRLPLQKPKTVAVYRCPVLSGYPPVANRLRGSGNRLSHAEISALTRYRNRDRMFIK